MMSSSAGGGSSAVVKVFAPLNIVAGYSATVVHDNGIVQLCSTDVAPRLKPIWHNGAIKRNGKKKMEVFVSNVSKRL